MRGILIYYVYPIVCSAVRMQCQCVRGVCWSSLGTTGLADTVVFSRQGSVGMTVGLDDLRGLFQP